MNYPTVKFEYKVIFDHGIQRVIYDRECDHDDAISDGWKDFKYAWKHFPTGKTGFEWALFRNYRDFLCWIESLNNVDENWKYMALP